MKALRTLTNATAALVGLVIFGALVPSTSEAQSACYVPGSGTMYRIKEPNTPAQCSTGHIEFQLSAAAKPSGGGGGAGALPVNQSGAYDFSNLSGFVAVSLSGLANMPMSGPGRRLEWIAKYGAFRAGEVDGTQWDEAKIGSRSAALGFNNIASGITSFAAGSMNSATGTASVALGSNNTASNFNSFAAGSNSTASSTAAFALGQGANASGPQSVALGNLAAASGNGAVSIGNNTTAIGSHAFAIGNLTVADGNYSTAMGNHSNTTATTGSFVYGDASSSATIGALLDNSFIVRAQHFWLGTSSIPTATAGRLLETSTGAYLSTGGTWTNTSDVNKKHAFKSVDAEDLLARIDAMPVSTWTYNTESDSVRHMGPTAQDFRKAFGLGDTEKAIATVDADGVSLAAVKALIQRTTKLHNENTELRDRATQLSKQNDELRSMIADLAQRLLLIEQARR